MSDFDLAGYCETDNGSSEQAAICQIIANTDDSIGGLQTGVNTFFLLFGGALVFMMQSGFAMLCAGSVRQKNVKNIMLKNLLDACGGAIGFYTVGYGIAYGGDDTTERGFIGNSYFGLRELGVDSYAFFFFQFAFAATAATIVAGTVAERCKMSAYLCYSLFLTGFVYPIVARSVWSSNGFLSAFGDAEAFQGVGVIDFAGSGVVHMTGGVTALIAAIVLGPRKGRFYDEDGNPLESPTEFPAHSVALQILGTFILWFGWYGFNPGSALAIDNAASADTAALCAVTTTLAAAAGCVTSMFTDSLLDARNTGEISYDLTMAMNGALGGLVAITAGTSVVTPWAAIIIGVVGGWVYLLASRLLIRLRIDDAVDAVPVHGFCGFWGVFAVGLFANATNMNTAGYVIDHEGLFYEFGSGSGDATLLGIQCTCLAWVIGWVTALMTPFFILLNMCGMFRVDALEEDVGLDISHHRGAAYDLSGPDKDHVEELMEVRASKHGKVEVPMEVAQAADVVDAPAPAADYDAEQTA